MRVWPCTLPLQAWRSVSAGLFLAEDGDSLGPLAASRRDKVAMSSVEPLPAVASEDLSAAAFLGGGQKLNWVHA